MTDVPGGVPGGSAPFPGGGPFPGDGLRVGNAEREQVAQRLQAAFAEGRLETHELQERLDAVYRAKTAGELRPLTADLPGAQFGLPAGGGSHASPAGPGYDPASLSTPGAPGRAPTWPGPASWAPVTVIVGGLGFAFAVNVVIWAVVCVATGQLIYFWPIWVALPVLLSLVGRAFGRGGGVTGGPGSRFEYRQQRRAARRRRRSGWG